MKSLTPPFLMALLIATAALNLCAQTPAEVNVTQNAAPPPALTKEDLNNQLRRAHERLDQLESLLSDDLPPSPDAPSALSDDVLRRLDALEDGDKAEEKSDDSKPTQEWSGRLHTDYWAFPGHSPGENAFETGNALDTIEDRFLFRRIRIGLQGTVPDFMLYKLEVDFNNPESPHLKDNFVGWDDLPYFQTVLLGNQKRPYGLDHINSSRYNVFLERPAIIEALNQDSRRFGLVSYGFTDDLRYNWRYGGYMGRDIQAIGTLTATPKAEDYQAEIAGRLARTLFYEDDGRHYAHFATAGAAASTDGNAPEDVSTARFRSRPEARTSGRWLDTGVISGADNYEIAGIEGVYNLGSLQVVGEYQNAWVQRNAATNVSFHGGYVYVSYFLTGEHMPWDRETGQLERIKPLRNFYWSRDPLENPPGPGAWQVAARYSYADLSDADILGGIESNFTLGVNWWWNPYARLQFNYIYGRIHDRRPIDGFTEGDYHILGTRVCVDF